MEMGVRVFQRWSLLSPSVARVAISVADGNGHAGYPAFQSGWNGWISSDLRGGALSCTSVQPPHPESVADSSAASPRSPEGPEMQHPSKTDSMST